MRNKKSSLFWVVLLVGVIVGCTPKTIPAPVPTVVATQVPVTIPSPNTVSVGRETASWDQVVKAAKKEGEVTIYSFNFIGDVGLAMARAFENRYGIKLQIITGRGAEFIERLKTEKRIGQQVADFSEGSSNNLLNMKLAGLTVPLTDLPVIQEKDVWLIDPLAVDPEAHVLSFFPSIYSPWINTRLLKPEQAPTSFHDLLKPEWKGKIISHDPNVSSAAYSIFVPLVNARILDWDYVRALGRQEMRLTPGPAQAAEMLSRGEFPLVIGNGDATTARFVLEGAPIKAISFREGNIAYVGGIVAIKDASHPNAAKVLGNWLLSEEGQRLNGETRSIALIRKGIQDFRPLNAQAPPVKLVTATAKDFDDQARLMRERFITELWKR